MDEEVKSKANPNIVLVLDYVSVSLIMGSLAAGVYMKLIDSSVFVTLATGILIGMGVYKATK